MGGWGGGGAGYVVSMDLVREVAAGAALLASPSPGLFKLEDIAMGSWVQYIARDRGAQALLPAHAPSFPLPPHPPCTLRLCREWPTATSRLMGRSSHFRRV